MLRFTFSSDKQHEMASHGDRLFARGLKKLPTALREATVEAEPDEPTVLQNFRSFGKDKLGLYVGGKRAHMVLEHGFASSAEDTADIKENLASAVGDASESKFHSEVSAGNLANVLSGKKRRTKAKRRQAPRGEVVEPRVEFGAGEMNSCDGSRHGMVPLVLENSVQGVASFPSFPTNAEIPVPGEMTSKEASDFPAMTRVEESLLAHS